MRYTEQARRFPAGFASPSAAAAGCTLPGSHRPLPSPRLSHHSPSVYAAAGRGPSGSCSPSVILSNLPQQVGVYLQLSTLPMDLQGVQIQLTDQKAQRTFQRTWKVSMRSAEGTAFSGRPGCPRHHCPVMFFRCPP